MEKKIYIVKGLQNTLVGHPAIQALNLYVARIEAVQQQMVQKFPELFRAWERFRVNITLKMKAEVNPFVLTAP